MDYRLLISTFVAIFVAEMGDKTQLATLSLAAGGSSRWVVFAGAALALIATSAIAVLGGEALSRLIPPIWLKRGAGVIFIVLGVLYLIAKEEPTDEGPAQSQADQAQADQAQADQAQADQAQADQAQADQPPPTSG